MKSSVKLVLILTIFSIVYFGNHFIQSSLGEDSVKALNFPVYNLSDGISMAKQQDKLLLVDYSAIWCPTCRRLNREVFADSQVANTILEKFVYVRLEYDSSEGQAFAKNHQLQGFPRVNVVTPTGQRLVELPLVFDPVTYESNLRKALALSQ